MQASKERIVAEVKAVPTGFAGRLLQGIERLFRFAELDLSNRRQEAGT